MSTLISQKHGIIITQDIYAQTHTLHTHRCFAIVSAATFIKSFVVTVTGSLVIISCTVCPKILRAVSESSLSPNVTKLPLSSLGKKSNELTNPTRRFTTWSVSAFLRRSITGAPDTPAWSKVAMASSTGVWGARVKRWGWEVIRSDTMRFVDLVGVEMKTRCCCCWFWLSGTENERDGTNAWRSRRRERRVGIVVIIVWSVALLGLSMRCGWGCLCFDYYYILAPLHFLQKIMSEWVYVGFTELPKLSIGGLPKSLEKKFSAEWMRRCYLWKQHIPILNNLITPYCDQNSISFCCVLPRASDRADTKDTLAIYRRLKAS